MLRRRVFCLLCTCLMLAPVAAQSGELRIVTLDLPPYWYHDENKPAGICGEIGNAVAEECGLVARNIPMRLHRGLEEMRMGRADMIILLASPEAESVGYNLGQLFHEESVVIGLVKSGIQSPGDLVGKRVASIRGARYTATVSAESGVILSPATSYLQSLNLLLEGRVDAVLGPRLGLEHTIKMHDLPRMAFSRPLLACLAPVTVYVSRHVSVALVERVRAAIQRLVDNGTVERIRNKYLL
ncbi:transporter substrate-binding domain-containing protein [uncultured Pseudodesulfovibrio sp.]|uniref:substrate-binding periplasmic protein n=1 Tax=uncultured Pseudodesulfovibrio sp. TaxID=2035858 RepID=UPI0029C6B782|nr:transporter substrate-binding domain-containing protein [uncultured Pseudodesulfovibrio sp.]